MAIHFEVVMRCSSSRRTLPRVAPLVATLLVAACSHDPGNGFPAADLGGAFPDATVSATVDATALDDLAQTPDLAAPDLAMDFAAPDLATPDFAIPDFAMPDFATPDFATPDFAMPDFATPDLAKPDLAVAAGDMTGQVCDPNAAATCADPQHVKKCRSDGLGYQVTPCDPQTMCVNGTCPCLAGAKSCAGNDVVVCMNGTFVKDKSCGVGFQCNMGVCEDIRCNDEIGTENPYALPPLAWGRFRHDNRNSGASPVVLAATPTLKTKLFVGGTSLNQGGLASGPVINQKNVIFIGAGEADGKNGAFYAFDSAGKAIFTFLGNRGFGISTPAVRNDGYSYFSTTSARLYAVTPQGAQGWLYNVMQQADSDPLITKDGTLVYGSDEGVLYALKPDGTILWKSDSVGGPGEVDSGLAETCAGQIYAGGRNGWTALDGKTGATLWKVPATGTYSALLSSPLVNAATGTMYGVDSGGVGYAIDSKGKVLWQKALGPSGAGSSVARVGTLLFTVLNDGKLHAVDAATGAEKWSAAVGNVAHTYLNAGPIVDGAQRVYFNSSDGYVYAFDTAGKQLWKLPHSGKAVTMTWSGTMAIGMDATLYCPGNDGYLYLYQ